MRDKIELFVEQSLERCRRDDDTVPPIKQEIIDAVQCFSELKSSKKTAHSMIIFLAIFKHLSPDHVIDVHRYNQTDYRSKSKPYLASIRKHVDHALINGDPSIGGRCCFGRDRWQNADVERWFKTLLDFVIRGDGQEVFLALFADLLRKSERAITSAITQPITEHLALNLINQFLIDNLSERAPYVCWAIAREADPSIDLPKHHNSNDKHGSVADINGWRYSIEVKGNMYLNISMVGDSCAKARKSDTCRRLIFVVAGRDRPFASVADEIEIRQMVAERYPNLEVEYLTLPEFAMWAKRGLPGIIWDEVINRITEVLTKLGTPDDANTWDKIVSPYVVVAANDFLFADAA